MVDRQLGDRRIARYIRCRRDAFPGRTLQRERLRRLSREREASGCPGGRESPITSSLEPTERRGRLNWALVCTLSLVLMTLRWDSTVLGLNCNFRAISIVFIPWPIIPKTCNSRLESVSAGLWSRGFPTAAQLQEVRGHLGAR